MVRTRPEDDGDRMRGWAIVCVSTDEVTIQHLGALEQIPGFDDRKRCEQIVGRINRKQALGRYTKGTTNGCYYVALPYPVVLEAPTVPAHDLDDIDPL
jgi:hypothetical protein